MTINSSVKEDIVYRSFKDFYPFYLSQHANVICRNLHFVGSCIVIGLIIAAIFTSSPWLLVALPLVGYGFAWIGHFVFEKNRPATFIYPLYSLMGDWVMFWQILTGKISMTSNK